MLRNEEDENRNNYPKQNEQGPFDSANRNSDTVVKETQTVKKRYK
jgi:hypothetical protein